MKSRKSPAEPRAVDPIELLGRAERRIAALEERLALLEGGDSAGSIASAASELSVVAARRPPVTMEEVSSRRGLFKVAGAVASAAVAHSLLASSPAGASTTGPYVGLGVLETTTAATGVNMTQSGGGGSAFQATNLAATGQADGLKGVSDNSLGAGVVGSSANGYGVYGITTNGYAVYANGRLGIGAHLASPGPPAAGAYELGDIVRDSVGNIFACVGAGSAASATAVFRKLTGPASAGQLHVLPIPLRSYDSRPGSYGGSGGDGAITNGLDRTVSMALGRSSASSPASTAVPAGASAVLLTLSLVETAGAGFMTVYSNAVSWPGTASITWFGSGQILSTSTVSAIDSQQRVKFRCGGQSTQFIVDVVGYYR